MRGSKIGELEEFRKRERELVYLDHKRELRKRGIDPDWIGSHEVEPVCCGNCGHQIPWRILKGWAN